VDTGEKGPGERDVTDRAQKVKDNGTRKKGKSIFEEGEDLKKRRHSQRSMLPNRRRKRKKGENPFRGRPGGRKKRKKTGPVSGA